MSRKADPEALAVAYDAIRDAEFNGIPAEKVADALMQASVNLSNDGYDTLGGPFDPGTWESIRTGESHEKHGVCPVCDWQHTYELVQPTDGEEFVFCPRDGTSEVVDA